MSPEYTHMLGFSRLLLLCLLAGCGYRAAVRTSQERVLVDMGYVSSLLGNCLWGATGEEVVNVFGQAPHSRSIKRWVYELDVPWECEGNRQQVVVLDFEAGRVASAVTASAETGRKGLRVEGNPVVMNRSRVMIMVRALLSRKAEVRDFLSLLGSPNQRRANEDGSTTWVYIHSLPWAWEEYFTPGATEASLQLRFQGDIVTSVEWQPD